MRRGAKPDHQTTGIADLERRVEQLEKIVTLLCEDAQDDEEAPQMDIDGNVIPKTPVGPHDGI